MKATIKRVAGKALLAKSDSNHWVPLDAGPKAGGTDAASSPSEMLLIAAGACTAMDQLFIIGKSRKELTRYEMELEGIRAETHPKIFREIHFRVVAEGEEVSADQFKRAMELSLTKYCTVSLSLDRSIRFFASFTLNGEEQEEWELPRDTSFFE